MQRSGASFKVKMIAAKPCSAFSRDRACIEEFPHTHAHFMKHESPESGRPMRAASDDPLCFKSMKNALRSAKFLEPALLFTFIAHGLGMLAMAGLLLPGMPGGPHDAIADRAGYVAGHAFFWRFGWFWFQLTAFSDFLLSLALVMTGWIPKLPATLALLFTICAICPDQYGQAMWTWHGVSLAISATAAHDYSEYAKFEPHIFMLIAGWGTIGYLLAALCWTWCFASARTWHPKLTFLSFTTWGIFTISTAVIFLPSAIHPPLWGGMVTAAGNAIAFILLMIWFSCVTEMVLRRSRPTTASGHWALWQNPATNGLSKVSDLIANSRFVRRMGEHIPTLAMSSDITDVIYINYLVPRERLLPLVPAGLELQLLGEAKSHAMFSVLTYRHGHFGPSCFGTLRRWWPSPIQSNWRIYVIDSVSKRSGVHFVTTAITSVPLALAARILSEGVPMHIPQNASLNHLPDGSIQISVEPGNGSAPDLHGSFRLAEAQLPDYWRSCFESWAQMLGYCVPQDCALAPQLWYGRIARQEIALGIPVESCKPLSGTVQSAAIDTIVGDASPVCFKVDRVAFGFLGEQFDEANLRSD